MCLTIIKSSLKYNFGFRLRNPQTDILKSIDKQIRVIRDYYSNFDKKIISKVVFRDF